MHIRGTTGRRLAWVAGLAVLALGAGACSSGGDNNSGGNTNGTGGSQSAAPVAKPDAKVTITPDAGSGDASPSAPIVVKVAGGKLTSVTMTNPAKGTAVKGSTTPDGLTWTSGEDLAYGASYDVVADAVNGDGKKTEQKTSVHTVDPKTTAYPSMIPAPNPSATFGVGQIIGVTFDHDIADKAAAEKALQVTSSPSQPGGWYWIDKRTLHYRPQTYWQAGTTITLNAKVYGINLGGGVFGETDRTATYKIHDSWVAKADGKSESMQILHNGQVVKTMPISLGSPGYPTHEGPHVISDHQPQVIMDSCTYGVCKGQKGYYHEVVKLDERISNDGEFVHAAPWSVGQQGSTNVSHGCVNLSPDNAQWFFDNLTLGDVVEITNSGGKTLPVWDTYGDWELSWADWQAGSALH